MAIATKCVFQTLLLPDLGALYRFRFARLQYSICTNNNFSIEFSEHGEVADAFNDNSGLFCAWRREQVNQLGSRAAILSS